jgi:hypothetical protein
MLRLNPHCPWSTLDGCVKSDCAFTPIAIHLSPLPQQKESLFLPKRPISFHLVWFSHCLLTQFQQHRAARLYKGTEADVAQLLVIYCYYIGVPALHQDPSLK